MSETPETTVAEVVVEKTEAAAQKPKRKRQPPYHVILWNDDDHTYDYVIRMLKDLFGHPPERGMQIATEVDSQGKSICLTTTLELAELKRDQIHAYGRDRLLARSKGSMSASIQAAE